MENNRPELSKVSIIVVSHIFADGPAQALVKYLRQINMAGEVLFIGHPLLPRPKEVSLSEMQIFKKGKKKGAFERHNFGQRFSLHYLENFFVTIYWVLTTRDQFDIYIGANNLNALSGIVLKFFGRVKKVVFYCVDYAPKRFSNPLVNFFYHLVDKMVISRVDEVWFLSPRMIEARKKYKHLSVNLQKCKIVPMGVWFDEIKRVPFNKVNKHSLVFMGHLLKKQGVQYVIRAIPKIMRTIPDFKFVVIGKGEYEGELKKIAKEEKVESQVDFVGYIDDHNKMERLISKCACAVALYEKGDLERNFTYYADPGKIKDYLGAGLPVILTDVSYNAHFLEKSGCGIVINYDKKEIVNAVTGMLKDTEKLKNYKKNALKIAGQYDWNEIFYTAFKDLSLCFL